MSVIRTCRKQHVRKLTRSPLISLVIAISRRGGDQQQINLFLFANGRSGSLKARVFLDPKVPKEFNMTLPSKKTVTVHIFNMIDKTECEEAAKLIVGL